MVKQAFWSGRKVFITGHTGFMGGWLSSYLLLRGADVTGFSLLPPTSPSFFEATKLGDRISKSMVGDIRDANALNKALVDTRPSIVFHLAAQALVRRAHVEPRLTYETNVMGTVNLLEAVRNCETVRAVLVTTTDKVYRNTNRQSPYHENDPLGGTEAYSSSKAGSELVLEAYRNTYFRSYCNADKSVGLAAIRAGNVIGGGDWATDRLVPDAMRRFVREEVLMVRNPASTRPWQHVLDPLPGYLSLARRLYEKPAQFSTGWNFGSMREDQCSVGDLVALLCAEWGQSARFEVKPDDTVFEECFLTLDSSKAAAELDWHPRWRLKAAIAQAVRWYRTYYSDGDVWALTHNQCTEMMDE